MRAFHLLSRNKIERRANFSSKKWINRTIPAILYPRSSKAIIENLVSYILQYLFSYAIEDIQSQIFLAIHSPSLNLNYQ